MTGAGPAPAEALAAVGETLALYLDGLRHSDVERLRAAFHPAAHYVCATGGTLLHRRMEEYLPIVAARPSPESRGEPRRDAVRSVEFAGPDTARACVLCSIGDEVFTDFLTLIRVEGRWRIISKVFHREPLAPTA